MQTAVPAGTAVFRGKWKRTDSRFAAFGGRGELRSPLSSHRNAPSGHSGVPHGLFYDQAILWLDLQNAHAPGSLRSPSDAAPKCFFKTSRCSARLIFRFRTDPPSVASVPLGLFGKPKRSSFSRVRGLHQAILWPLLQNARPPGSLRSPSDAAPKCFFKTSRCSGRLIRQAETLELQPLRGLRWAGGASLPPAPPSPAALRIRGGQLQRLPLRGAGAQRLKGGCAMAMRSSAG